MKGSKNTVLFLPLFRKGGNSGETTGLTMGEGKSETEGSEGEEK